MIIITWTYHVAPFWKEDPFGHFSTAFDGVAFIYLPSEYKSGFGVVMLGWPLLMALLQAGNCL